MDVKVLLVEKSWPLENFLDHGKTLARGKLVNQGKIWALWKIYWSKKNLFLWKNLGSWKTSSKDKSFLVVKSWLVESFLEQGKCWWQQRDSKQQPLTLKTKTQPFTQTDQIGLWETPLIQKKYSCAKIFACGKLPWSRKNLGLRETFLIKKKS